MYRVTIMKENPEHKDDWPPVGTVEEWSDQFYGYWKKYVVGTYIGPFGRDDEKMMRMRIDNWQKMIERYQADIIRLKGQVERVRSALIELKKEQNEGD